jgi:hypothetical protein
MNAIKRSIQTAQIKLREMNVLVNGASAACTGPDASQILSASKGGTGVYVINLKYPFEQSAFVKSLVLIGNSGIIRVAAVTESSVTINTFNVDGTTAADKDFGICILGSDFRFYH